MIQTMNPEHQVIRMASNQDYDSFYDLEIGLRRMMGSPPFGDIATITFTGQDETAVLRGAVKFRDSLNACLGGEAYKAERCTVLGPAPCVVPKINYNFRYRLTLRCAMTRPLRLLVAHLLRQFAKDRENRGVCAYADVNGYE
jgi:primosomal protein N' (replication factor Y)